MKKVSIDSNILIYFFEGTTPYHQRLMKLFSDTQKHNIQILCSALVWSEILTLPFKENLQEHITRYTHLDDEPFRLVCVPVSKHIAISAASIRAKYGFKIPDAIHLATALEQKADYFLTNDKRLNSFKEIPIHSLEK